MRPIIQRAISRRPTIVFGAHAEHLRLVRKEIAATQAEMRRLHAAAAESDAKYARLVERLRALLDGAAQK